MVTSAKDFKGVMTPLASAVSTVSLGFRDVGVRRTGRLFTFPSLGDSLYSNDSEGFALCGEGVTSSVGMDPLRRGVDTSISLFTVTDFGG